MKSVAGKASLFMVRQRNGRL